MKIFPVGGEWERRQVFHPNVYRRYLIACVFASADHLFNVIRQSIHPVHLHLGSCVHIAVVLHNRPLSGSFEFLWW